VPQARQKGHKFQYEPLRPQVVHFPTESFSLFFFFLFFPSTYEWPELLSTILSSSPQRSSRELKLSCPCSKLRKYLDSSCGGSLYRTLFFLPLQHIQVSRETYFSRCRCATPPNFPFALNCMRPGGDITASFFFQFLPPFLTLVHPLPESFLGCMTATTPSQRTALQLDLWFTHLHRKLHPGPIFQPLFPFSASLGPSDRSLEDRKLSQYTFLSFFLFA